MTNNTIKISKAVEEPIDSSYDLEKVETQNKELVPQLVKSERKRGKLCVDYALQQKIGIFSKPCRADMNISFKPQEKINWQIEGEALAIKYGVIYFIEKKKLMGWNDTELIIKNDNKILFEPFNSKTQAGIWLNEAYQLAEAGGVKLKLKFICGAWNPADILTRDPNKPRRTKEYYFQQWLKKNNLTEEEFWKNRRKRTNYVSNRPK